MLRSRGVLPARVTQACESSWAGGRPAERWKAGVAPERLHRTRRPTTRPRRRERADQRECPADLEPYCHPSGPAGAWVPPRHQRLGSGADTAERRNTGVLTGHHATCPAATRVCCRHASVLPPRGVIPRWRDAGRMSLMDAGMHSHSQDCCVHGVVQSTSPAPVRPVDLASASQASRPRQRQSGQPTSPAPVRR